MIVGALSITSANAQTWDGGSAVSINWNDAANWNRNAVPANDGTANLTMTGTFDVTNTVNINFSINSLTFANNPAAPVFTINGTGSTSRTVDAGGNLSVGGASLVVLGPVTHNASVSTQPNSTIRFFGPVSGPGSYSGPGTVEFLNSFSPGASPAEVFMSNFILGGSATLVIELGGTLPGSQYDKITASGTATLGGTLDIDLIDGFIPSPGNAFQFLTAAGGINGNFGSAALPELSGANWQLEYNPTSVLLRVAITGDYNHNGTVDAADYTVWRNSLDENGIALAADGNGDSMITHLDYAVWKANYGATAGSGSGSNATAGLPRLADLEVPEPQSLMLFLSAVTMLMRPRIRHKFA